MAELARGARGRLFDRDGRFAVPVGKSLQVPTGHFINGVETGGTFDHFDIALYNDRLTGVAMDGAFASRRHAIPLGFLMGMLENEPALLAAFDARIETLVASIERERRELVASGVTGPAESKA